MNHGCNTQRSGSSAELTCGKAFRGSLYRCVRGRNNYSQLVDAHETCAWNVFVFCGAVVNVHVFVENGRVLLSVDV